MSMSAFDKAQGASFPTDEAFQSLLAAQQSHLQPSSRSKPMDSIMQANSMSSLLNQFAHSQEPTAEPTAASLGAAFGESNLSLSMINNCLPDNESTLKNGIISGGTSNASSMRTQRRRSTLQFLNYVFDPVTGQPQHKLDSSNDYASEAMEPLDFRTAAFDYKSRLSQLKAAMEKAQKSQQDIHDWDRKMGLKKSHSKTMRLTRRSRKKILKFLSKEINSLKRATK